MHDYNVLDMRIAVKNAGGKMAILGDVESHNS